MKIIGIIGMLLTGAALAQDITFTNKFVNFTDLRGVAYIDVRLVKADLDGIIYLDRETVGGGRVCYTNLAPALLELLDIPTNRIETARVRAEQKAVADAKWNAESLKAAQERFNAQIAALAQRQADALKAAAAAEQAAAAAEQQAAVNRINQLQAQCQQEREYLTQLRRDVDMSNALGDGSITYWVDPNRWSNLEAAEAQLERLRAEYAEEFGQQN